MCPSKHSPVGIQETLTESNRGISTSGFAWESLGPNASIEFHPGQEGQDVAKVPGSGRGPRLTASFTEAASCREAAGPLPTPNSQKAGRAKGGILQLADPQLESREGGRLRKREEEEEAGKEGAHGRHVNSLAMADPTRANLNLRVQQGHQLNKWVLNCSKETRIHSFCMLFKLQR